MFTFWAYFLSGLFMLLLFFTIPLLPDFLKILVAILGILLYSLAAAIGKKIDENIGKHD